MKENIDKVELKKLKTVQETLSTGWKDKPQSKENIYKTQRICIRMYKTLETQQ